MFFSDDRKNSIKNCLKSLFSSLGEIFQIVIIALLIVIPIRYFLFQPFFVRGHSMETCFYNGDYLIVDQISYRIRDPQRGEVIVFKYPLNPAVRYIKRIVGLPGETIEIEEGKIKITLGSQSRFLDESDYISEYQKTEGHTKTVLGDYEYFVLGDNRPVSSDSRKWGSLNKDDIIGRVYLRAWPVDAWAQIEAPNY